MKLFDKIVDNLNLDLFGAQNDLEKLGSRSLSFTHLKK